MICVTGTKPSKGVPSAVALGDPFQQRLADAQAADLWLPANRSTLTKVEGLWYKGNAVYVPELLRADCLRECHGCHTM
jgi:hypothetical protein